MYVVMSRDQDARRRHIIQTDKVPLEGLKVSNICKK